MRMGAAQHRGVQHIRELHVIHKRPFAGQQMQIFKAFHRLARVVHPLPPCLPVVRRASDAVCRLCGRLYTRADRQSTSDAYGLAYGSYGLYNRLEDRQYATRYMVCWRRAEAASDERV